MAIIGIGNAIVDIVTTVEDDFLKRNNFEKGSMVLIDQDISDQLEKNSFHKLQCGGSAANTIFTISQLGDKSKFIGKVANDSFGRKFAQQIAESGVQFYCDQVNNTRSEDLTAKSFVLVSPDGQRTMCTYLGCASEISDTDIKDNIFIDGKILFLEGYLWDRDSTINALKKSIRLAKENNLKIALSLSDPFCVLRHKNDFLNLIKKDIDILFANQAEFLSLIDAKNFDPAQISDFFADNSSIIAVITRSEKGCVVYNDGNLIPVRAVKVKDVVDTTGAGDAFAAGFLHGIINQMTLEDSAKLANEIASQIIQKYGSRFEANEIDKILLNIKR